MVKKIFSYSISLLTAAFTVPLRVLAQDNISLIDTSSQYNAVYSLTPSRFVRTGINLLLGVSGVTAFIILLLGGFQLITAGGDKDAVGKAQKKIMYALIGLAVVFSAYAFIYVVQVLFQVNLINFTITNI